LPETSCARGDDTIYLRPLEVDNIFAFIRQVAQLFRHVGYLRHQQQVDRWSFDLESGVRVACDVGYLCANFSLPRPLVLGPMYATVRRQTKASLNVPAWGGAWA